MGDTIKCNYCGDIIYLHVDKDPQMNIIWVVCEDCHEDLCGSAMMEGINRNDE